MRTPGDYPDVIEVVVEIPRGSRNKYEFDETAGVYRLDRVLSSAVFYNFDYGFVEETRAGDGDHTDALLVIDEPTFTGCHVWARPIGGLEMLIYQAEGAIRLWTGKDVPPEVVDIIRTACRDALKARHSS